MFAAVAPAVPTEALSAQQARREAIGKARQVQADKLVDLKMQRSHLEAEGKLVFAATGSARFLAAQLGTDAETVIRWLVLVLVLLIDPTALALTIAATKGGGDNAYRLR